MKAHLPWALFLCTLFLAIGIYGQNDTRTARTKIDSIEALLPKCNDSLKIWHLKELARLAYRDKNPNAMEGYLDALLQLAKKIKTERALADAYHSFSDLYLDLGRFKEALPYGQKMLLAAQKANYPKRISQAYNHMGIGHGFLGEFPEARSMYLKAAEVNEQYGFVFDKGFGYNNIGRLSNDLGMYDKAMEYFEKVRETSEELQVTKERQQLLGLSWYGKARVYFNMGQYEKAIATFNSTIGELDKYYVRSMEYTRIQCASRIAQSHLALGQLDTAEAIIHSVLQDNSYPRGKIIDSELLNALAEIHFRNDKLDRAETVAEQALAQAREMDFKEIIAKSSETLANIQIKKGNNDAALKNLKLSQIYQDSLFNEAEIKAFARMEIEFDTQQKEQEIMGLQQERTIQKLWFTILAIILVIVGILAVAFWYLSELRETKNKRINEQREIIQHALEEKEVLLLEKDDLLKDKDLLMNEIHHRAKNNLLMLESLLTMQTSQITDEKTASVIQKNKSRLEAIRLLHQQLFYTQGTTTIEIIDYLDSLIERLRPLHPDHCISFSKGTECIHLTVDQAVALGLITNEILTNAFKYAFATLKNGTVRIKASLEKNIFTLQISDNGTGMPLKNLKDTVRHSGLYLVNGLARQIRAKMGFTVKNGTTFTLSLSL